MRMIKWHTDENMVEVFQDVYDYLRKQNLTPNLYVMDNEFSKAIKTFIKKEKVNIQPGKPHNHCVNVIKPAVKVARYHTTAALATANVTCPLRL